MGGEGVVYDGEVGAEAGVPKPFRNVIVVAGGGLRKNGEQRRRFGSSGSGAFFLDRKSVV